jgi:hypothetical protein
VEIYAGLRSAYVANVKSLSFENHHCHWCGYVRLNYGAQRTGNYKLCCDWLFELEESVLSESKNSLEQCFSTFFYELSNLKIAPST